MEYRPLGNTGLTVSVAGLGCGGNSRLGLGRGASFEECGGRGAGSDRSRGQLPGHGRGLWHRGDRGHDGKRLRWLDTPHVPHNGDAGLIYEETTGTLFSSDLFTQTGPATPTTESDIVAPAIAVAERLPFMPPTTIALMHGPTFKGDGVAALEGSAEYYKNNVKI